MQGVCRVLCVSPPLSTVPETQQGLDHYLLKGVMVYEIMKTDKDLRVESLQHQTKYFEIYPVYSPGFAKYNYRPNPHVVYDYFYTPIAELSGCDRNGMILLL